MMAANVSIGDEHRGQTHSGKLSADEYDPLRCQFGISKGRCGRRYLPYAFTEYGAIMAAFDSAE